MILLFEGKELVRILQFTSLSPNTIVVEGFRSDGQSAFTTTLQRKRTVNVEPHTQLMFDKLTRGRTPHAKLCFVAPRSVIILEEEKCRTHHLPDGFVAR